MVKRIGLGGEPRAASSDEIMASVVAILDLKGKPLIQRSYRDDVDPNSIESFLPLLLEVEEEHGAGAIQPCMSSQGINYMHVRHNNLYCV